MSDAELPGSSHDERLARDPWWTPVRLKAASMCADFVDNRDWSQIAKACKITRRTLFSWRIDPRFIREVDRLITERRRVIRSEAYRALISNLRSCDQGAVRDALKLTGELVDRTETGMPGEFEDIANLSDEELEQRIAERRKALEPGEP